MYYSHDTDSFAAGRDAMREILAKMAGTRPDLLLLFSSIGHDLPRVIEGIGTVVGRDIPLCGCTGSGIISAHGSDEATHSIVLLGLADFPILIGLKLKLLFEIASIYGFNVDDYKERVYLLHIFELAFSSHVHRKRVYLKMADWDSKRKELPEDIHQFDWRSFQQEYRDYIDLAKMAQMVPVIGAPVGAVVNYRLIEKLGLTAMNAYRMRLLNNR